MKISAKTAYKRGYRYGLKNINPLGRENPYEHPGEPQRDREAAEMWRLGAQAGANVQRLRALRDALAGLGPAVIW